MVIKGGSKGHAARLAAHLTRTDHNDRVEILELDESAASPTVDAVLREYQAISEVTRSSKGLYEASINPTENDPDLTHEQWVKAADILEGQLGLKDQPRVIVLHEKQGREHIHVVWQRTDIDKEIVIDDSWNYRSHELAAREIEQQFNLEITPGVHSREKGEPRPERSTELWEFQQSERAGMKASDRKVFITNLFEHAETARDFTEALENNGFHLARGDQKNIFMLVDPAGEQHSLTRQLNGYKKKDVEAKLSPLKPENFKTASEVKAEITNPEQAPNRTKKIHTQYDEQKAQLENDFKDILKRREATHRLTIERKQQLAQAKKPSGFSRMLQDYSGVTWVKDKLFDREMRILKATHQDELNKLKQNHLNNLRDNEIARNRELTALNQEIMPDKRTIRARFELNPDEQPLGKVQTLLNALKDERENNDPLNRVEVRLRSFRSTIAKIKARGEYLEALDATVASDFERLFKDNVQALEQIKAMASENGIQETLKALTKDPGQFGELHQTTKPIERLADIKTAAHDLRREHYLRTKIENEVQGLQMYERAVRDLQEQKSNLLNDHSDERLALMYQLHEASFDLDKAALRKLSVEEQHLMRETGQLMGNKTERDRAIRALKEQRRMERHLRRQQRHKDDPEPDLDLDFDP